MKRRILLAVTFCLSLAALAVGQSDPGDQKLGYSLLRAAFDGKSTEVAGLLDAGARADFICGGMTPLIAATMNGHKDVAEVLLSRGADVNQRSEVGPTALIQAAQRDNPAFVELLLNHRADVTLKAAFVWKEIGITGDSCRDADFFYAVEELCKREDCCMTALCVATGRKVRDLLIAAGAKE
jgi:hypothetical protein